MPRLQSFPHPTLLQLIQKRKPNSTLRPTKPFQSSIRNFHSKIFQFKWKNKPIDAGKTFSLSFFFFFFLLFLFLLLSWPGVCVGSLWFVEMPFFKGLQFRRHFSWKLLWFSASLQFYSPCAWENGLTELTGKGWAISNPGPGLLPSLHGLLFRVKYYKDSFLCFAMRSN